MIKSVVEIGGKGKEKVLHAIHRRQGLSCKTPNNPAFDLAPRDPCIGEDTGDHQ